jgi:hypothetical protein
LVWLAPNQAGKPEVTDFEDAIFGEEHVLWFEITVDDAVRVDELTRLQYLPYYLLRLSRVLK